MERIVSPEERMRRAEEIYYRRRSQGVRVSTSSVSLGKSNKISLGKKMSIQILICVIIYSMFWVIKGNDNVFSQNVINQTKTILNYDINFQNLYNQFMEYFNKNFNSIVETENNLQDENIEEIQNNSIDNNMESNVEDNQESNLENNVENNNAENNVEDINEENNKAIINAPEQENNNENIEQSKTQMELDVEFIKQNCSLIIPIQGNITSGYGNREPTEIISEFHQGVDISAVTGTPIHASMEGTVVAASYAGDYGNHIKIQNGEVLTVYAHCSELEVCVGDYIQQGQEIGKVGATGKVTGPHLHFEIRKEDRYVDPALILNF